MITYLIRIRFPGVLGQVHINESEKKTFLDILGDEISALDLDEFADLESVGDRPIDRLDGIVPVRANDEANSEFEKEWWWVWDEE